MLYILCTSVWLRITLYTLLCINFQCKYEYKIRRIFKEIDPDIKVFLDDSQMFFRIFRGSRGLGKTHSTERRSLEYESDYQAVYGPGPAVLPSLPRLFWLFLGMLLSYGKHTKHIYTYYGPLLNTLSDPYKRISALVLSRHLTLGENICHLLVLIRPHQVIASNIPDNVPQQP